jgi:hypothetical protein
MYTTVERRKVNQARLRETLQRAQAEYFPKLQKAPGFVGFSLVEDGENGIYTAILDWESKAQAEAFYPELRRWEQTLEELGHALQSDNRGERGIQLQPQV